MQRPTFLLLYAWLVFAGAALADSDSAVSDKLQKQIAELRTQLDLSNAQVDELTPILKSSIEQVQTILTEYGIGPAKEGESERLSKEDMRQMSAELVIVREAKNVKLSNILSDEQMSQYLEWQKQRNQKARERVQQRRANQ